MSPLDSAASPQTKASFHGSRPELYSAALSFRNNRGHLNLCWVVFFAINNSYTVA
jgi:hypothetical protein